ncbi:MAG: hypothetical protein ACK5Z5_01255 [Neisseriaceae bacterium]
MVKENLENSPENVALNNVINKLQIYMDKNKQTLYGLATTMGFAYQPFYRLVTKKHLPTISSFGLIASHLNCSISELANENIFIDICCYTNMSADLNDESGEKCRVYISYQEYQKYLSNRFFAVKCQDIVYNEINKVVNLGTLYHLFYCVDSFLIDGIYLVKDNDKKKLINVLSISSKFLIIEENGKEVKVDIEQIQPIAKLFSYLELNNDKTTKLFGIK